MSKLPALKAGAKLGIMGGTFDPIHYGHLMIAEQMRDAFGLHDVLFIPAGNPYFKIGMQGASPEDRYEMTELAVAENKHFFASNIEIERAGVTYTVDTLKALKKFYHNDVSLYFITGADSMATLPTWKGAQIICDLAELIATSRYGYNFDLTKEAMNISQLNCKIHYHEVPELAISSTDIRLRIQNNKTVRYLLPDAVNNYILKNKLYRKSMAHESL